MTEHEKARAWRQSLGLTQAKLGERLGYSKETIVWFEKGCVPPNASNATGDRRIKPWIWQRYKLACCGLNVQIGIESEWNWEIDKKGK